MKVSSPTRFTFILIWISLSLLIGAVLFVGGQLDTLSIAIQTVPISLLIAGIIGAARYTCRAFPVRHYPISRIITVHITDSVIAASVAVGAGWLLVEGLKLLNVDIEFISQSDGLMTIFVVTLLAYFWSVTYHYLTIAVAETVRAENQILESEFLASDAELKALRAKLNPHFLFNSLNSIAALTTIDAAKAREMCISLSDFMRQSLTLGNHRTVPLIDEMTLVRAYLAVEQIRFQDKMSVIEAIDAETLHLEVPPLLLQPLVENAVKHGVAALEESGWIRIEARIVNRTVQLQVENPMADDTPPHTGCGQGLSIVKRRITSYFGNRGDCKDERVVTDKGMCFRVTLTLPSSQGKEDE